MQSSIEGNERVEKFFRLYRHTLKEELKTVGTKEWSRLELMVQELADDLFGKAASGTFYRRTADVSFDCLDALLQACYVECEEGSGPLTDRRIEEIRMEASGDFGAVIGYCSRKLNGAERVKQLFLQELDIARRSSIFDMGAALQEMGASSFYFIHKGPDFSREIERVMQFFGYDRFSEILQNRLDSIKDKFIKESGSQRLSDTFSAFVFPNVVPKTPGGGRELLRAILENHYRLLLEVNQCLSVGESLLIESQLLPLYEKIMREELEIALQQIAPSPVVQGEALVEERGSLQSEISRLLSRVDRGVETFNSEQEKVMEAQVALSEADRYELAFTLLREALSTIPNDSWIEENIKYLMQYPALPKTRKASVVTLERALRNALSHLLLLNSSFPNEKKIEGEQLEKKFWGIVQAAMLFVEEGKGDQLLRDGLFKHYHRAEAAAARERRFSIQLGAAVRAEIASVDFTLGVTLEEVPSKARHPAPTSGKLREKNEKIIVTKPLAEADVKIVESAVGGISCAINEAAMHALFKEMEGNCHIFPSVIAAFREEWQKDDGGEFGVELKSGEKLLSQDLAARLLRSAKRLSSGISGGEVDLAWFGKELEKDLKRGSVVISDNAIQRRYPGFFGFLKAKFSSLCERDRKAYSDDLQRIVGDVLISQELERLQRQPGRDSSTLLENSLLKALKLGRGHDQIQLAQKNRAEVQVLGNIMKGKGLAASTVDDLRKEMDSVKRGARLEACGVARESVAGVSCFIGRLEKIEKRIEELLENESGVIAGLPDDFPSQQRSWLIKRKACKMKERVDRKLQAYISSLTDEKESFLQQMAQLSPESISEIVELKFAPFIEEILSGVFALQVENSLKKEKYFHLRWKDRVVGEMIQGVFDEQEVLTDGVCHGNATRRAVLDQKHPKATASEIASPETIKVTATDRVRQAMHGVNVSFMKLFAKKKKMDSAIDANFPPNLRKSLGIAHVEEIFCYREENLWSIRRQSIESSFKERFQKMVAEGTLESSNGVAYMSLSFRSGGHATYMRFDPSMKIYRLGDPNIGVLEFPDQEEFFACLSDLITRYYTDTLLLTFFRFTLS